MLQWLFLFESLWETHGFSASEYWANDGKSCLSLANRTSVQGVRPEPVLITARDWLSTCVASMTVRIVLEEIAGQNVSFVEKGGIRSTLKEPEDLRCRSDSSLCQDPQFASDADMESWRVVIGEPFHRDKILVPDPPIPFFPIGYNGVSGLYYTPSSLEVNESQAFDFYKRHLSEEVLSKFPLSGTVNVTDIFAGDIHSKDYCGNAWNLANPLNGQSWCTNGRYVPSYCSNSFPCREIYKNALDWDQGWIEMILKNNNLRYTVAYIRPMYVQTIKTMSQLGGAIFYWYEPDPLVAALDGKRIQFPRYYPGCQDGDTSNPDGTVKCDYKDKVLYKLLAPGLRTSHALAWKVLERFAMTSDEIKVLLSAHMDASLAGGDCWEVSCNYVKQAYTKLSALVPTCVHGVEEWNSNELKCTQICKPHEVGQDCVPCAPGWVPDWQQTKCEPCKKGQYTKPNHTYNVGDSCDLCPLGQFQSLFGQSQCELCAAGTAAGTLGSTACHHCDQFGGVFFYAARSGQRECLPCPEGAVCPKNGDGYRVQYFAEPGWYRMMPVDGFIALDAPGMEFGRVWQCPNSDKSLGNACLGWNLCANYTGEVSMEGALCGRCREGFAQTAIWSGAGICKPCHGGFGMFVWIALGELLVFGTIALNSLFHLTMDHLQPMEVYAVVLKQLMNYSQMLMVIMDVVVFNNFDIAELVGWSGFLATSPMETVASKDCLLMHTVDLSVQYRRVIMAFFELPFYLLVSSVFFLFCSWIHSWITDRRFDRVRVVPVVVICLFVIQPRLTRSFLSTFQCAQFDTPRLKLDLSVDCKSDEHFQWEMISMMGFVFYSLGIPFVIMLMLLSVRNKLEALTSRKKFGFLYNGFELKYYYFEVVYLLRKVLFQVAAVLPRMYENQDVAQSKEDLTRVMALLVISVVFLAIHISFRPFDNRAGFILDSLESAGLWAITNTLLVKSFTTVTDQTVAFSSESSRRTRDTIAVIFLLTFHLNFFRIAIWGLVRPIGLNWIQTLHRTRLRNCLNFLGVHKEEKFMFGNGVLHVGSLSKQDLYMLGQTLSEVLQDIVEGGTTYSSWELDQTISWCCTESRLMREKTEIARAQIHLGPSVTGIGETKVSDDSFDKTFSNRSTQPQTLGQSFGQMMRQVWQYFRYAAIDQIETVPPELFQKREEIEQTFGHSFKVEELQVAVMRTRSCILNRRAKTLSGSFGSSQDFGMHASSMHNIAIDSDKLPPAVEVSPKRKRAVNSSDNVKSVNNSDKSVNSDVEEFIVETPAELSPEVRRSPSWRSDSDRTLSTCGAEKTLSTTQPSFHMQLRATEGVSIVGVKSPRRNTVATPRMEGQPQTPPSIRPSTPPSSQYSTFGKKTMLL